MSFSAQIFRFTVAEIPRLNSCVLRRRTAYAEPEVSFPRNQLNVFPNYREIVKVFSALLDIERASGLESSTEFSFFPSLRTSRIHLAEFMAYFANATEAHVIVAQQKNFTEISEMLKPYSRVLVAGCGTCVAVCLAGGEREAGILAGRLRLTRAGDAAGHIISATVERQCDREFLRLYADTLESERIEAIVSLACGAGIQFLAQMYPDIPVFPGVNTGFIGVAEDVGVWTERCRACNQCFLALTGGICPITMCAKSLLNGPCGGPQNGKCETSPERECAWVNIIERLERQNRLHLLMDHLPPRSHEPDAHPGRVVVESYKSRFGE